MRPAELTRAVAAALATAASLGLTADDAVVLHDSNRLTLRVLPCDVLVRVAPAGHRAARFEIEMAQRLAGPGRPVATLDPRVAPRGYERDGFVITFWTYYGPAGGTIAPADYAAALGRLHAGMRGLDVPTPHARDRVREARQLVASRSRTPALTDGDRELLGTTLERLGRVLDGRADEQVLHGEPHPGNVLSTKDGPLFVDLETCCRGPVEFDVAHAPEEVAGHYPGLDRDLVHDCRVLVLAMITTWRWDRDDDLPDGRHLAVDWLDRLRAALAGDDRALRIAPPT
ncbi:MAG TPA: aminoglycoside phosphotransferase family protein [Mycobacteriales bacterium]|nr:aminoglycoside phosphotransferase family protein [Mycobacteriales bacterium]